MASVNDPSEQLEQSLAESARVIAGLWAQRAAIALIGDELVRALQQGGKVLTAGNGGSAAEALHMAEELVGRFKANRPPLAAVALVADPTALTCIGNDFGFDAIFSRQVEALGRPGDVLVLFSTSGRAANLRPALAAARDQGLKTVCLLGRDGGELAGQATHEIIVRHQDTARIQEAHQVLLHVLLEIVDSVFTPVPHGKSA